MKKKAILILTFILGGRFAAAESLSFPTVWDAIQASSPAQEASRLQQKAAEGAQQRASLHWLPRLYLDARTYRTNDPGSAFFGLLQQRSLRQSDFDPEAINHPDESTTTRGALGVDWAFYEGGMKSAQVDMLKHVAESQRQAGRQIRVEQYAQSGRAYASLVILDVQDQQLKELDGQVARLVGRYELGSRANPVGYSGLLGLKSLRNHLAALLGQSEAQRKSFFAMIREMGLKKAEWTPQRIDPQEFVEKYLRASGKDAESSRVTALREEALAAREAGRMEKARFLPRVGAFAEASAFQGSRDTANAYTAGLYLQWSLFNPADDGVLKESRLKALAAERSTEAFAGQERAEKASLSAALEASRKNMELLDASAHLLNEQTQVTEKLFRNGSISALQMVEVLNRRADLITQQGEARLNFIQAAAQVLSKEPMTQEVENEKQ